MTRIACDSNSRNLKACNSDDSESEENSGLSPWRCRPGAGRVLTVTRTDGRRPQFLSETGPQMPSREWQAHGDGSGGRSLGRGWGAKGPCTST